MVTTAQAFLVVDCPSSASFDSLKTAGIDGALEAEKGTLKLVFHQLGPGVALDESYWAWASSITEAEVCCGRPLCCLAFELAHSRSSLRQIWTKIASPSAAPTFSSFVSIR